jgi:homoserine/homoserine lactone efflux protein
MSFEYLMIYITTVFVASIIPGPSMLLALNHGIKYGIKISVLTALGNVTATLIQAIITIIGLSIILVKISLLFNIIKYIGAAYIIYIGIRTIINSNDVLKISKDENVKKKKAFSLFNESFLVTIGNPKAVVFFTALFPQFINRNNETLFTSFILTALLLVIAFISMMIYIVFGQNIHRFLNNTKRKFFFNRIIGFPFLGLGIGLVFSKAEK